MANVDETTEAKSAAKEAGKTAGLPLVPLVAAMVVAVVIAVAGLGGGMFWLLKSGRLALPSSTGKVDAIAKVEIPKFRQVALEPLLVNLSDEGGRSYLRLAITLRIEDPPAVKGAKPKEEAPVKGKPVDEDEATMRDAALGVLGRETGEALLAPEGKDHLKGELRGALKARLPEVKVVDVLFTEFLVQR